ncbi:hypothetical protein RclHR1_02800014 [Rhizophagus clarus]|uniref:Protein kinase domain-containing protein n=1 Tax=Rhizophagus clarus TaxID=94130 RepID=A0A2Z6RF70_9GLOM|nr:hypothetical protein RclHR1_02800014 [Rhizophagus clarus]
MGTKFSKLNILEGWTSGNPDIYKFIKESKFGYDFLEWVPFDRFTDVREIGEGGFAKVYSATWIDSKSNYYINDDGNYKKMEAKRKAVALRKLNESQNMPEKYLNELKIHWNLFKRSGLQFYGLTKESETKEFMMVLRFANKGNLRNTSLSNDFNNFLWKDKIKLLRDSLTDLARLHKMGYFHSGNILRINDYVSFIPYKKYVSG